MALVTNNTLWVPHFDKDGNYLGSVEVAKGTKKSDIDKELLPEIDDYCFSDEKIEELDEKVEEEGLGSLKISELRSLAKDAGIHGYSDMKKDELVEALQNPPAEDEDGTDL